MGSLDLIFLKSMTPHYQSKILGESETTVIATVRGVFRFIKKEFDVTKASFTASVFNGTISLGSKGDIKCLCVGVKVKDTNDGEVIAVEGVLKALGYSSHWLSYEDNKKGRMLFIMGKRNGSSFRSLDPKLAAQIAKAVNKIAAIAHNAPNQYDE